MRQMGRDAQCMCIVYHCEQYVPLAVSGSVFMFPLIDMWESQDGV